jgi:carboxypeptidase C (cathepsin A)
MRPILLAAAAAAFLHFTLPATAETCAGDAAPAAEPVGPQEKHLPPDVVRPQRLNLPGGCLAFRSIAGSVRLTDAQGEARAEIAYVAFLLDGAEAGKRPVVFAINGGPGASSGWLDLGALGPWRLPFAGLAPSSPPRLLDNADTWLDFADLVFIDPAGTGYSRPRSAQEAEKANLWSVEGDARALAETIRRWLADHGRLGSPKFIVGESYGGFRAPKIAKQLVTEQGVGLDGVILLSPVLDFSSFSPGLNNPFPYLTRLPSYAAAAREAKGPVARADLADVETYATGEYLEDWLAGPRDPAATARKVGKVASLTGLPADVVSRYGGDLDEEDYLHELGRLEGRKLAYYDATIGAGETAPDWPDPLDPVLPGYEPALASAMVDLYRTRLGWRLDDNYEILNGAVSRNWSFGSALHAPEALGDLAQMLALDPGFRVLVAHGLTDVQAPYFATALALARLPPFAHPDRLTFAAYPGGHMFYGRDASRAAFRQAARRLIEGPP